MTWDRKYKVPCLLVGVLLLCVTSVAPLIGWLLVHDFILHEVCAVAVNKLYTPVLTTLCYYFPAFICILAIVLLTFLTKTKIGQLRTMDRQESLTVLDPHCRLRCQTKTLSNDVSRRITAMESSRKCITTLSLVCILCWAPFYVANLKIAFCNSLCIDPRVWTLLLWLGYSSYLLCPPIFLIDKRIRFTVKSWISTTSHGEMDFLNSGSSTTSDYSLKTEHS